MQELISALKGCRDALDAIPEGIRGVHDHKINRALRRADKALFSINGNQKMSNLYQLRDIFRTLTYTEMERFAHLLASNTMDPHDADSDYDSIPPKSIVNFANSILLACDQIDLDEEEETPRRSVLT